MNNYYEKVSDFQEKLKHYANCIFKAYGKELVLRLEEYNLLQNKHNCIESSTAIGFVLEEFLVSKLEMFTHCDGDSEYIIDRFVGATASESFDCYSIKDNMKYMVNVKAEKVGSSNAAVAAISQLYRNYCQEEVNKDKCFILFKIKYSIKDAYEDDEHRRAKPRHLYIDLLESYNIESVDFSNGWSQDNRSWKDREEGHRTRNNGRLQISSAFRTKNRIDLEKMSFRNTACQIDRIWHKNEECWRDTKSMLEYLKQHRREDKKFQKHDNIFQQDEVVIITYMEDSILIVKHTETTYSLTEETVLTNYPDSFWMLIEE